MTTLPTILSNAQTNTLLSITRASKAIDLATLRLATGKRVNSALDNPQNFFTARALQNRSSDLSRLLDGIGSSIKTIEEAANGTKAVEQLLKTGESYVQSKLDALRAAANNTPAVPSVPSLNTQILADSPIAYYRLNDSSGTAASNLGSIGTPGTYQNGPTLNSAPLYSGGANSVTFNGTNQFVSVPNNPLINTTAQPRRSVEVVFNATTTTGRQVLYEEGGTSNAFSIYVFNGSLYVNGRDSGAWGPVNISQPIVAGQTYHAAFTFDFPNGIFRGYLDGVEIGNAPVNAIFPAHSSAISIGSMNNSSWFHDGSQSGNGFYFNGRISDVAVYNAVLSATQIQDRASAVTGVSFATPTTTDPEFEKILDQIDQLVEDANYRGINLLKSDNLTTYFNEDRSSVLKSQGVDFTADGLGIKRAGFDSEDGLLQIIDSLQAAITEVRRYTGRLSLDLSILTIRDIFTRDTANVLTAGAQELTDADQNEEGATLLAAQTRQQLSITSLAVAMRSSQSVLNLFA